MHAVILASREGWHTQELTRALGARGHTWALVPYEGLTASLGGRPGLRSGAAELDQADVVLPRIVPAGSLEQIVFRMDALHRLEVGLGRSGGTEGGRGAGDNSRFARPASRAAESAR